MSRNHRNDRGPGKKRGAPGPSTQGRPGAPFRPSSAPRPSGGGQPGIQDMCRLLERSQIRLNDGQVEQLWRYHNLIRNRNQDRELTRIIGFEPVVIKHYVDCMIVGQLITLPSPIVDVGTGAGFPGIPLKIRYPHLKMILAEPRPKRIAFLKEACDKVGLKNVEIFEHKVVSQSFHQPVKAVITRAVETIDKTILRTSAAVEQGGWIIFMKGPGVDPELDSALDRFGEHYKLIKDQAYVLPGTPHHRRLVVLERLTPRGGITSSHSVE